MPNAILEWITGASDTAKSLINTNQSSAIKVNDPDNIDSQLDPADIDQKEWMPKEEELRYIRIGNRRFKSSSEHKRWIEKFVIEGAAFYAGHQWHEYNSKTHSLVSMHPDERERYYWQTFNLIEGFVNKKMGHVLGQYPDLWTSPLTTSESDMKSAQVGRSILAHCNRRNSYQQLLRDWVFGALVSSTTYDDLCWDASAEAEVALPSPVAGLPMGQATQPGQAPTDTVNVMYKREKIGDVCEKIRLCTDVYPDPNAKTMDTAEWVIVEESLATGYIKQRWTKRGKFVKATHSDNSDGSFESRVERVTQGATGKVSATDRPTHATVRFMYELPSARYPRVGQPGSARYKRGGRYWVWSGDVLLECREWPYDKCDGYPLIGVRWKHNLRSIWGDNFVTPLKDPQRALNKAWTKILGRMDSDKLSLMVPRSSKLSPDAYTNPYDYQKFTYDMAGGQMLWNQPPPLGPFHFNVATGCYQIMCNIAQVHDLVSDDNLPPNLSGKAIELWQTEDKSTAHMWVTRELEPALVKRAEWQLALYKQFGTQQPRLLGLDDKGIPASPVKREQFVVLEKVDLEALKDGRCRVICTPGSGIAKNPVSQDEDIAEMFKAGAFGPPGTPPSVMAVLKLKQSIRNDENIDNIIEAVKQYDAAQPNPLQVQQQKDASAQAALQAQQEHEQALQAIRVDAERQIQQARVDAETQLDNIRTENQLRIEQFKASVPSVALTGKLDNVGLPAAEQIALGTSQSPEELASQQQAEQKAKAAQSKMAGSNAKGNGLNGSNK